MFCTNCGKQIDKDDLFCIYCGEEMVAKEETEEKKVESVQVNQQEKITTTIQEKFDTQVTKAQSELGKVKNKAEAMREKSRLSNTINDAQAKKAKLLAELGLLAYEKIRTGQINDLELTDASKSILGFDYIIYDNSVKIEELEQSLKSISCGCGATVSEESKFCTGCGKKVEIPVDTRVFTNCEICEARIEDNTNFCPCCGNKR